MTALLRSSLAAILILIGTTAFAHTSGTSFLSIRVVDSDTVQGWFDVDLRDLDQLLQLDRNLDGALTWGEIDTAQASIEDLVLARTQLSAEAKCSVSERAPLALADHGDGPFARVNVTYRCAGTNTALSVDHHAWFEFDPEQRALLEFTDARGKTTEVLLSKSSPRWESAESTGQRLRRFLLEGAFHLITGYDHLAFLGVLLLALARRRPFQTAVPLATMLKRAFAVITAFTVAHSATLALAATGKLVLPSKPVEVTIAASVMLAAILNLRRDASVHGAKLAFVFGLVHGLGFAGALAEMAADRIDLWALAAFNIGIEMAQIAIAAVTVPLVWRAFRHTRSETVGLPAASLSVAALAGFWMVSRLNI